MNANSELPTTNRIGWLSLDDSDNEPARFLTYLIAALNPDEAGAAPIGELEISLLQASQPPPSDIILTRLINELSTLGDKIILILDDYHHIERREIHDALQFLLENVPPQLHLVIVTREDPLLPLSRLRAGGQLTELRAADLRFTSAEAAEFLNQVMDLQLSGQDITALENRTEGWTAGLQMAALSMQGHADASQFIHAFSGSHRFVLDFLVEEVLQNQPHDVRDFLLQTAILDRLSAALCAAITGHDDSQERLQALERGNLFVMPLDNEQ